MQIHLYACFHLCKQVNDICLRKNVKHIHHFSVILQQIEKDFYGYYRFLFENFNETKANNFY